MSSNEPEQVCTYDPLIEFINRFESVSSVAENTNPFEGLTPEDILQKHIVSGIKKDLDAHLDAALAYMDPLSIVNNVLLAGMKTVGELFGSGKMQLPFVLQSAEVMKTAVRYLEPLMEKSDASDKGSILLATVAGDVHDIGKNLVDIILSNNGYRVVNIGIKQPIQSILTAAAENKCQVIGMSGLLVKSTLIMRDNLEEMNRRSLSEIPVILGGAALTRSYVEQDLRRVYDGRVYYAQDAFEGLSLMATICSGDAPEALEKEEGTRLPTHRTDKLDSDFYVFDGAMSNIEPSEVTPKLPFYGARYCETVTPEEIYPYINPIALFRGQWQFKRAEGQSNPEFNEWLETNVQPIFASWKARLSTVLTPKVAWGYFPCYGEGNDLIILSEDLSSERVRFTFPRQRSGNRLCLADYFRRPGGATDTVGFQVVTVGPGASILEKELFEGGAYQDYLFAHGMAVESAEALAEHWHFKVRQELGIDDAEPEQMRLLFSARYHGSRFSFGYPACPNLEDQAKLMELLKPEKLGIELTEEFMLTPEQSTSAIVVHHPRAGYFNIR